MRPPPRLVQRLIIIEGEISVNLYGDVLKLAFMFNESLWNVERCACIGNDWGSWRCFGLLRSLVDRQLLIGRDGERLGSLEHGLCTDDSSVVLRVTNHSFSQTNCSFTIQITLVVTPSHFIVLHSNVTRSPCY